MKPIWAQLFSAAKGTLSYRRDQDDQIPCPVVAFYSLKGGIGRTTALVNTAVELGAQGIKVVCLDLDLEAPSLHDHFSNPDLEGFSGKGLASLLSKVTYNGVSGLDIENEIIEATGHNNVWYMPAGRVDETYINAISSIDPLFWGVGNTPNPLIAVIDEVKKTDLFDVILIDSRTGLNAASASVLAEVSDIVFVGINPHPQSRHGTGLIVKGLQSTELERAPFVHYFISPLTPEPEARRVQLERVYGWLEDWALDRNDQLDVGNLEEIATPIDYLAEVSMSTRVRDLDWSNSESPYTQLVSWILQRLPEQNRYSKDQETLKGEILRELDFTRGVADSDPSSREGSNSKFIETDFVRKAKMENTALVVGRKGTGKTAIFFNLLSDSSRVHYIAGTAPAGEMAVFTKRELLNQSNVELVHRAFSTDSGSAGWRKFWLALMLHAVVTDAGERLKLQGSNGPAAESHLLSVSEFVGAYGQLSESEMRTKLADVNAALMGRVVVLFDGLDSVFGSSSDQLEIRRAAVEGLLDLARDLLGAYANIGMKIFIRRDIWDQCTVQNKSHLRAASVELEWARIQDFMRLGVAYAIDSSEVFARQVRLVLDEAMSGFSSESQVAYWPDEAVKIVWDLIFGERMAGGRTAFTHKWVWLRTADANDAHAPRDLLMLLNMAKESEYEWHQRGDLFHRCLIRPRALRGSIEKLSESALSSLGEEFPELSQLISDLPRQVRNSPFEWSELVASSSLNMDDVKLACEVGLIDKPISDGTRGRIPDLYRHGLNIGRKGQK